MGSCAPSAAACAVRRCCSSTTRRPRRKSARPRKSPEPSGIRSGAVLPGVDVTAMQTDTGFRRSAVTDANGLFVLSNLPIGPYRLEAMLSGFRSFQQTGIVLQVNANPEINITLSLGEVTETVAVQAATPLVETRSPGIGQVIENERIEALPLNGRNPVDLITLAGAAVPQPALDATSRSMQGGRAIAVAGGQSFGVAYMLDGATHNNPYDNLNLPLPFPDALQEFRLETSSTTANNGVHSSASVNAVTKSGTNTFHGDLFEFVRNHRFNADQSLQRRRTRPTGERAGRRPEPPPVRRHVRRPAADRPAVLLRGVSGDAAPRDAGRPVRLRADSRDAGRRLHAVRVGRLQHRRERHAPRGPFVNNRVDPSRLSPAALKIAEQLPTTNDPCGRFNYSQSRPQDEAQYIGKVDLQLTPNHSMFGRVIETRVKWTPPLELRPRTSWSRARAGATTRRTPSPSATRW